MILETKYITVPANKSINLFVNEFDIVNLEIHEYKTDSSNNLISISYKVTFEDLSPLLKIEDFLLSEEGLKLKKSALLKSSND